MKLIPETHIDESATGSEELALFEYNLNFLEIV